MRARPRPRKEYHGRETQGNQEEGTRMSILSQDVIDLINGPVTGVLGTAAPDGTPNAVPVGAKAVVDERTVMVSDQFFGKTRANIDANPKATLSIWTDGFGVQVKGSVSYETDTERAQEWIEKVNANFAAKGRDLKSRGICFISIEAVYSTTPGDHAGELLFAAEA